MPIARACDRCHQRRIKCDGLAPCHTCSTKAVQCKYDKPVQRKGPKPKGIHEYQIKSSVYSPVNPSPCSPSIVPPPDGDTVPSAPTPRTAETVSPESDMGDQHRGYCDSLAEFTWPTPGGAPDANYVDADQAWQQAMSALDYDINGSAPSTAGNIEQGTSAVSDSLDPKSVQPLPLTLLGSLSLSRILAQSEPYGNDLLFPQTQAQAGSSRHPHQSHQYLSGQLSDAYNVPPKSGWQNSGIELIEGWGQAKKAGAGECAQAVKEAANIAAGVDFGGQLAPVPALASVTEGREDGSTGDILQSPGGACRAMRSSFAGSGGTTSGNTLYHGNTSHGSPELTHSTLVASSKSAPERAYIADSRPSSALTSPKHTWLGMPREIDVTPAGHVSPLFSLVLDTLIYPQMDVFLHRTYPMIPVFNARYLKSGFVAEENKDRVAMMMAMSALSLVHPLTASELKSGHHRAKQAATLIEEALRIRCRFDFGDSPTLESIMTSYLIFGALFEMGHSAGASLRLREAIVQGETMGLHEPRTYEGLDHAETQRRLRVYWILAITERAYALQRKGSIILDGGIVTRFDVMTRTARIEFADNDPISQSLQLLAQLFSFVSRSVTRCWNYGCDPTTCHDFSLSRTVAILARLEQDGPQLFGHDYAPRLAALTESQRADFLITWQWLRSRIWRAAALHDRKGKGAAEQLGAVYVVDIVEKASAMCQSLSLPSMEAHGTGFVEKLYDIACTAAVALRSSSTTSSQRERLLKLLGDMYTYVLLYKSGSSEFAGRLAIEIDNL